MYFRCREPQCIADKNWNECNAYCPEKTTRGRHGAQVFVPMQSIPSKKDGGETEE
jgi:hypothetical protein